MSIVNLEKKIRDLEAVEKQDREPPVLLCSPSQADALHKRYPNTVLIIDDIPKTPEADIP